MPKEKNCSYVGKEFKYIKIPATVSDNCLDNSFFGSCFCWKDMNFVVKLSFI